MRNHWAEIEKYLEDQKIAQELIGELRDFHMRYEVEDQVRVHKIWLNEKVTSTIHWHR